jgi:hypothetical protein
MPKITLKETITRKIEIPLEDLVSIIDNLTEVERKTILKRLTKKSLELKSFKKDKLESIIADFSDTSLYDEAFLKDLEDGLKKSSVYK